MELSQIAKFAGVALGVGAFAAVITSCTDEGGVDWGAVIDSSADVAGHAYNQYEDNRQEDANDRAHSAYEATARKRSANSTLVLYDRSGDQFIDLSTRLSKLPSTYTPGMLDGDETRRVSVEGNIATVYNAVGYLRMADSEGNGNGRVSFTELVDAGDLAEVVSRTYEL